MIPTVFPHPVGPHKRRGVEGDVDRWECTEFHTRLFPSTASDVGRRNGLLAFVLVGFFVDAEEEVGCVLVPAKTPRAMG